MCESEAKGPEDLRIANYINERIPSSGVRRLLLKFLSEEGGQDSWSRSEWQTEEKEPDGVRRVVKTLDDVEKLPKGTTVVHLSRQQVVNFQSIKRIIEMCPELKVIRIPQSYGRLVWPKIRDLMGENGIELHRGRLGRRGDWG